jgi:hypothetical protein
MQHKIYWGRLKTSLEWSLKTWLAPWSYIASVLYHDSFWYPARAKRHMATVLRSDWGRLFQNWETLTPDERGFPTVGQEPAELKLLGAAALRKSIGILGTCIREAPEFRLFKKHAHGLG